MTSHKITPSRLITITVAVVLLILATWIMIIGSGSSSKDESDLQTGNDQRNSGAPTGVSHAIPSESSRSRTKVRANSRDVTVEKTTALLRNSVAERVDLPEQTVADRIAAFERIILESGIDGKEIRVDYDRQNPIFKATVGQLNLRNMPLETVIRYICDSAKVRFQVSPGVVEFYDPTKTAEQVVAPNGL